MLFKRALGRLASVTLIASSFATTSLATGVEINPEGLIRATAGTLLELADELSVDYWCLREANPFKWILLVDELINVPVACCQHSCKGPFCCLRPECRGQTTSTVPLPTHSTTASVVITNTHSPTSSSARTSSSIITSTRSSRTRSKTSTLPKSSTYTSSTTSPASAQTSTSIQGSGSGSSAHTSPATRSTRSQTTNSGSIESSSVVQTLTEPDGSSTTLTLPPGSSITGLTTITTDGSTFTLGPVPTTSSPSPSNVQTLTEPYGSTIILTLPSGSSSITGLTTITTEGSTLTVGPAPSTPSPSDSVVQTLTEPNGSSVILTLPSGSSSITGLTTITTDGSTLAVGPAPSTTSPSNSVVQTLTEPNGSSVTLTLPSGSSVTGLTTITTDGSTLTVGAAPVTTTASQGPGIVIDGSTVPLPSSTETITDSDGSTIVIGTSGVIEGSSTILFPNGPTTITTDGVTLTFGGSASSGRSATTTSTDLGSATSATASPAITPPPPGSPGSIPDTIPAGGLRESRIAITFSGDTFLLPRTNSIDLLQSDGSFITLFSDSVVSGAATVTIPPPITSQTTLSSGGFSLEAGPAPTHKPSTGGLTGFLALLHVLEGLASTADSIVNKLDQIGDEAVLWSAGTISDAAFSDFAAPLLDDASGSLYDWTASMGGVSGSDDFGVALDDLSPTGRKTVFQSQLGSAQGYNIGNSLRKLVRTLTGLKNNVIIDVENYWVQGTKYAAAFAAAEEVMRNFAGYDWAGEKPRQNSTSSSSSSTTSSTETLTVSKTKTSTTSSSSATSTPYMFTTKTGTDLSTFQSFIKTLPDAGEGDQIVFPHVPWQSYVTNLTLDQAKAVASQTFVNFVTLITESDDGESGALPSRRTVDKRVAPDLYLQERQNSAQHLRLISVADQQLLNAAGTALPEYLFDPALGQGQTIYVVDSGFNLAHSEFSTASGRTVTSVVVPNRYTLKNEPNQALWAPEDSTPYNGHGTASASLAGGVTHGVASRANLVLVKIRNGAKNPVQPDGDFKLRGFTEPALQYAWDWIINDVLDRRINGNTGKSIVSMSLGFAYKPTDSQLLGNGKDDIMDQVLFSCWQNDIITVVAAGNDGLFGASLNEATPQNLGTPSNGLITVGGVDLTGALDGQTTFEAGGNNGGSITVYGLSQNVEAADWQSNTGYNVAGGTSRAAPAIAGLAAYFASLPALAGEWTEDAVATTMKQYIRKWAYKRLTNPIPSNLPQDYPRPPPDSIIVAYNRAPDGLCSNHVPSKRALEIDHALSLGKRQDSSGDVDVVVSGTIVASSLSQSYCSVVSSSSSTPTTSTAQTTSAVPTTSTAPTITSAPTTTTSQTTTAFVSCSSVISDPEAGIVEYCVCSGSTFAPSTDASATPINYCAYTSPLPLTTLSVAPPITTTTAYVSCSSLIADPQAGIVEYCVCSGSTFAPSTDTSATPINYCAYTSPLPLTTLSVAPPITTTPTTSTAPTSTPTPTTSTPTPTPSSSSTTVTGPQCASAAPPDATHAFYVYEATAKGTGTDAEAWTAGIVPASDWTCDGLNWTPYTEWSNSSYYPYNAISSENIHPPLQFTLDPALRCNENLMTFTEYCGKPGDYFVTSAGQGGTAICYLQTDLPSPNPLICAQDGGAYGLYYNAMYSCLGDIC